MLELKEVDDLELLEQLEEYHKILLTIPNHWLLLLRAIGEVTGIKSKVDITRFCIIYTARSLGVLNLSDYSEGTVTYPVLVLDPKFVQLLGKTKEDLENATRAADELGVPFFAFYHDEIKQLFSKKKEKKNKPGGGKKTKRGHE